MDTTPEKDTLEVSLTTIVIRACCVCRRQITGEGKACVAFGPSFPPAVGESTGFCYACFVEQYGEDLS